MDTKFAPMKQLGFPSKELVNQAGKYISKQFAQRKKDLHAKTGLGLNVKDYLTGSNKSRRSKGKAATASNSQEDYNQQQQQQSPPSQQQQPDRAEKWNIKEMSAYGQYIQEPLYRPTKVPGRPQQPLFQPGTIQIWPPTELISLTDQDKLLELYFEHVHTSMPILDVITMNQELAKCRANNDCFLSPLFFYALFALASRHARQDNPLYAMGDTFMQQAVAHRDGNFGYPCIASVLGLLLMVEYLQQMRDRPHASYAWMLAREAIGMVTDLGIYKPCNVSPDPDDQELAVRTFWAAFTTDRLMSLTYGRPFVFEEKDIGIRLPMITSVEKANFPATDQYLRNFSFLIDVSKVVGRIIRFNFSVQSAQLRVASLHQEAMLSTLDSWTASLIKEAKQCLTQANPKQQQFEIIKQLILHTLLILLHQPYVDHSVPNNNGGPKRNGESRYSFDICTYSAMIITQVAFDLSQDDLQYMMKRSPVLYTLITAMRVHLMNASYTADQESATHGEFSFLQSLAVMKRIQAAEQQLQMNMARNQQEVSLLTRTMNVLEKHFHARPEPILSNYANCQAQIMQSMPFPAISILSMQSTPNNASPSYEQFLTEASTPSSSSTSLSPGGMAGSTSVLFMDTSGNNNNESMNIFNDQMGDAQQGDISLQRTPPVSRPSGKGSGSNKHKKFIAYTATGASSSGGVKGPTSRLHKDTKQRNKKRRQSPAQDDMAWQQPQPQPQQQLQTASSPFQHNNFNFIQDTASTTSAEQQQPALQYPEAAMSENRMMQQDPPEVQLSQQQQHHHHHHHHHQSQPQPQPQQQQFHPYQDQNHGLYHQHNHSIHQEHQNPPSSTQHEVYNPLPTPATTSTTDTSYFSPEIQQLIEQNPNILVRASQAAAAMVSQGAGLQYPQGPQSDTTSMYFDPMIQMFSNEPASSSGALTNTMVTMTTQVSNTNFNPVISVPSAGMIPSSGNENLQAYFFPSPYHNNI